LEDILRKLSSDVIESVSDRILKDFSIRNVESGTELYLQLQQHAQIAIQKKEAAAAKVVQYYTDLIQSLACKCLNFSNGVERVNFFGDAYISENPSLLQQPWFSYWMFLLLSKGCYPLSQFLNTSLEHLVARIATIDEDSKTLKPILVALGKIFEGTDSLQQAGTTEPKFQLTSSVSYIRDIFRL
jgi:hypothetical protein